MGIPYLKTKDITNPFCLDTHVERGEPNGTYTSVRKADLPQGFIYLLASLFNIFTSFIKLKAIFPSGMFVMCIQ